MCRESNGCDLHLCVRSAFRGVCVLRELGWVRLLYSPGRRQLGVGDPPGHAAQSGRNAVWPLASTLQSVPSSALYNRLFVARTFYDDVDYVFRATEPGPQVPPPYGPLSGLWTPGKPLDVRRPVAL